MKRLFWIAGFLLLFNLLQAADSTRIVTVGIVSDTPVSRHVQMQRLVLDELQRLGQSEFTLHVHQMEQTAVDDSVAGITARLNRLQNSDNIDIILATGIVSGTVAATSSKLRKPTFAPLLVRIGDTAPAAQGSGIANFNYLETGTTFAHALEQFLGGVRFSRMALLLDSVHYEALQPQKDLLESVASTHGITLYIVSIDNDIKPLAKLPSSIDAVMIAPLPGLTDASRHSLLEKLKTRKLPSYTFDKAISVEAGALMGTRSSDDMQRRARQVALNIYEVLHGAKAEEQHVHFDLKAPLKVNMQTARSIGISPSFAWLSDVVQLYQYEADTNERLTLAQAAREAVRANLSLVAGMIGLEADKEGVKEVRSILFPQLQAGLGYTQNNSDNVYVENGFYAEKSTAGSLRLEQIIFSERSLARLDIAKKRHTALEAQQHLLELDIVYRTASAYINLLNTREHLAIRREQLDLVRANYELAKGRVEAGVSDRSDLYHWESMITSEQANVLTAEAGLFQAKDLLCTLLHRDMNIPLTTEEVTLDDPELLISRDNLHRLVSNEAAYRRLEQFYVQETLRRSPELLNLKAQTQAASRQLKSNERAYWSPDIAAYGETTHVFDETRNPGSGINLEDQTNWEAGIALSLPLYEGEARSARREQSQLQLNKLQTQQLQIEQELTRRIRADLHAMRASHPAIALSKQALQAAQKSYDLVRQNYAAGTRPMTDLLIVQSVRLGARQAAAEANYRFMNDLMVLQRDSGRFDFFLNDAEKDDAVARLQNHVAKQTENHTEQGNQP